MRAGLAKIGEPALLRGEPCGRVNIQHNVEVVTGNRMTEDDNFAGLFTVATLDVQYVPVVGDQLIHPDGEFKLDRLIHDNGVTRQYIVVRGDE